jgi:soluble lytic murein transglycosylase-like protein
LKNPNLIVCAVLVSAMTFGHSVAIAEGDDAGVKSFNEASAPAPARTVEAPKSAVPADAVPARTKTGSAGRSSLAVADGSPALRAIVQRHAAAEGVPFALADAIVRVESRYNPRASNKGNYGLMQIRHQTARGMGYGGSASGLLDAETNARFGMKYLAQAYRMTGGDTCRTVMKYQSGHMATQMSGANRAYCSKVRTYVASR